MKDVLLQTAMKLNKGRKQRKWWQNLVRVMAMVVVFCTTYALILPAITMEAQATCGMEAHAHQDACYTLQTVYQFHCGLEDGAQVAHTHEALCYNAQGELICPLPELEGHVHESVCYEAETVLVCRLPEDAEHAHTESCYNLQLEVTCQQPQLPIHEHSESCLTAQEQIQVLTCQLAEHIHNELCYPVEEDDNAAEHLCGLGEHDHVDSCYDASGNLACSIPVHAHDAACLVAELDLTADVETQAQWEKTLKGVTQTGVWSADVLAVAESQLGYQESTKNVILEGDRLVGYTRYGDWYGIPYGDWCAMFASFCLHYAEVEDFPLECQVGRWIDALTEQALYQTADTYTPKPGDLIFFDYGQRDAEANEISADHVGIVAELLPATETEPARIRTVEGNMLDQVTYWTYALHDPAIIGYGVIPENPLSAEEWAEANELAALVVLLPDAEQTRQTLEELNTQGDKPGFEALRQELISRIEPIVTGYEAFNELQKERVGSLDKVYALQEVCGGASWKELPKLEDDSAAVAALTAGEAEVVKGPAHGSYSEVAANNRTRSVHDGDTLRYPFTVSMESYYQDIAFSEARVKVELVLPMPADKAVLDPGAMSWLEEAVLTYEYRTINTEEVLCQVLTGYKRVLSDEHTGKVVSGTFTEEIAVNILDMSHGEKVAVIVSAAMEHGCWNGTCEVHGVAEKLSVVTETFVLYEPLSAEEQQAVYTDYLAQIDALAAQEGTPVTTELESRIHDSYCAGALSDDHYGTLYQKLLELSGMDLDTVAEPSKGNGWIWVEAEETGFTADTVALYSSAEMIQLPVQTAMPTVAYSSLGLDSSSQIPDNGWGGENSEGDMIWVSKTIEGTEQENVFDITLQIITKEEVNEVYEDPDMAVVVVMDISNTMCSVFSGETTVTRYDAAMDAAEQFMMSFAEETSGISKLGYVAFNTHGHEVFPMQECSTTTQAATLASTMRTKTQKIISDASVATGSYDSSHERFTNIEAGLAMAAEMLNKATNEHKYIIFLSDGFPTTYMTARTDDKYTGYDPYTTGGSNGTAGVFYDGVMGVHCDYGTSYSDTAAIKASTMAKSLKATGINIFSIGVDVEGQTIWEYHWDSQLRLKTASTVERTSTASTYNSKGYEIGTLHSEITKYTTTLLKVGTDKYAIDESKLPAEARASMSQDFKDWLKGTKTSGIGSGYYYESTDQEGLEAAYSQIFQQILKINAESSHLDWVATDPMPGMGVHELETIEFIGFWDLWSDDPTLVDSLSGKSQDSSLYYNTATFNTTNNTISWDLKNSGYQTVSLGNNKNFMCALKYRVRLMNEEASFVEKAIYDTNDVTSLTYRIIEVVDNVTQVSDQKTIKFPIPKVFGYLSELNFTKVDTFGRPLAGAKFALTHDTANCGTCRGDGEGHVTLPVYEAVSGADGIVSFTNIPSGHKYILTETEPPAGYSIVHDRNYYVTVSYDALTVTVTDTGGNSLDWTGSIENGIYYTLPNTGGAGTSFYTLGGLLIILAGACGYLINTGRKRQKGGSGA